MSAPIEQNHRNRTKDKMEPSSGHASSSPGAWISEVYIDGLGGDRNKEAFRSVVQILDSYRAGGRIVVTRADETLEELRDRLDRQPRDLDPFFMLEADTRFKEVTTFKNPKNRDLELAWDASKNEDEEPKAKYRLVSMADLVAAYDDWFEEPTEENHDKFFSCLYDHFSRKAAFSSSPDLHKLRCNGQLEDTTHDIFQHLQKDLEEKTAAGTRLEVPENYLNRSWKRRQITALVDRARENRFHPSFQSGADEDDDGSVRVRHDRRDRHDVIQNHLDNRNPVEDRPSREWTEEMIASLPESLRAFAHLNCKVFPILK